MLKCVVAIMSAENLLWCKTNVILNNNKSLKIDFERSVIMWLNIKLRVSFFLLRHNIVIQPLSILPQTAVGKVAKESNFLIIFFQIAIAVQCMANTCTAVKRCTVKCINLRADSLKICTALQQTKVHCKFKISVLAP